MGRTFGTMLGFFWVFYFTFSEDKQKDRVNKWSGTLKTSLV